MGLKRGSLESAGVHATVPKQAIDVVAFENAVVAHPNHKAAMDAIERLHKRWSPPTDPNRLAARALLLVGESGAGKSTVLRSYLARFPVLRLEDVVDGRLHGKPVPPDVLETLRDRDIVRVVAVEVPKVRTSERAFVAAIFRALGYKVAEHWNTAFIIERIIAYANELGVELILIDEGHHLVGGMADQTIGPVVDFLKSLLNKIGIPLVIAGLPRLRRLQHDGEDGQMRRRSRALALEPYDWGTRDGRIRVMSFIQVVDKH